MTEIEKKILIIDDDRDIRESLKLKLELEGFVPIVVDSGEKAIELVKENDFFLVLSDIAMPDMNGYEVFEKIKQIKPELPVVLMTAFGYDPSHAIIKAKKLGLYKWIAKPISDKKLKEIINTALHFYKLRHQNNQNDIND